MKSKPIISLQTMKIRLLDFHCLGLFFSPLFYKIRSKKSCQKCLNVVYLSEFTATILTYHDRKADVTNHVNVPLFLHATSGTDCSIFFLRRFLAFYASNAIWAYFLGAKMRFRALLFPLNTLNKTKLTRNACNERQAVFTSEDTKRYKLWSCQNVCEALIYLLDNICIKFGTK